MSNNENDSSNNNFGWWGVLPEDGNGISSEIRIVGGHIYFYTSVTQENCMKLNEALKDLEIKLLTQGIESGEPPYPIKLHIHSFGGSVFAGITSMDTIKNLNVEVHTIIEGGVASAGTFLSIAGSHRLMSRNSYMLIHQLSSGFFGKYEEIKDEVENLDELMDMIKRVYNENANVPAGKLEAILKRDMWFNSKKCLKYGLIDEII